MNKMHNLGVVIKFEIIRTLKKPSFWLMALGFPVLMAVIFGIAFMSSKATSDAASKLKDQKFSIMVTDESRVIRPELLAAFEAGRPASKQSGIDQVKSGKLDAYFYFPKDLASGKVEVYGKDVGLFDNSRYSAVANLLLSQSADGEVSDQQRAILQDKVAISSTTFRDGKEYDAIREMIVPGLFLVLFYLIIGFFGGQMLNSTIEEKENRTIEMLLTTVKAEALITGKILALIVLALTQVAVILVPLILLYLLAGSQSQEVLQLPNFDLSALTFDPVKITIGAAVFLASFLLFTGLLVAVGAAMPTAKEASQWFGLVMMLIFGPLYGFSAFMSYPDSPFVQFLSLFPLTSPIPLMLRNAIGNLTTWETLLGIGILAVSAILVMLVAVRIFRYGAMEYDSKISLKALRAKRIQ